MSRQRTPGARPQPATIAMLAGVLLLPATTVFAADPAGDGAAIGAHLAAGEFAPAMAIAQQAPNVQRRDHWLAQIAGAQAQAGARDAALRSAAEIYDDRVRTQAISGVAAMPLGGGTGADFDSLTDLITSTIQPTTWDAVGGPGSIAGFETGVVVDSKGVLCPLLKQAQGGRLAALYAASRAKIHQGSVRQKSPLRKISLPRLEKHVQLLAAAGRKPDEAMRALAGLQRIQYVFVYPESRDLVIAGPAGDWQWGEENRIVSTDTGQPVVQLDDLVVVLRHMMSGPDARFGCAITPTQQALARAKKFIEESGKRPLRSTRERRQWVDQLRESLGKQDIDVYGIDPRTRAAQVMVEADYRMKLVGIGLEEGVPGVKSYLESIKIMPGPQEPMSVLRWWFTLNYDAVLSDPHRAAFEIRGQGVKVLSENEMLTAQGKRIHTGKSEELNLIFVRSFTAHFGELCKKYPIYAELRNVFDLAILGAVIREEDLAEKANWHMTYFGSPEAYRVPLGVAPTQVDTVVNCRVIRKGNTKHIRAIPSGGVRVDPATVVSRATIKTDRDGTLQRERYAGQPKQEIGVWWWD